MINPLYLFVGRSASGKSTIASILEEQYNLPQVQSYTTRPKRYETERGHIFVSGSEFDKLQNIIGYTEYNNHRYCSTKEQLDTASIYVVDTVGTETLLERYESERPIVIFYFDATVKTRIDRMLNRYDHDAAIVSRLHTDDAFDWEDALNKLVWHYKNNVGRNVEMYIVDANQSLGEVLEQVTAFMELNAVINIEEE